MSENTSTIEIQSASAHEQPWRLLLAAAALSLGGATALGFGRFAYALLLEPMRSALNWTYAQAGVINSANAVGYLIGTIAVGPAVSRFGAALTVRLGMLITALSMLATGLLSDYSLLLLMRVLTGVGGGLIYVGAATVVLQRAGLGGSSPAIYYSGPGIGIAVSGLAVPGLLVSLDGNWRMIWLLMGGCAFLALLVMWPHLRTAQRPLRGQDRARGRAEWADYRRIWPFLAAFLLYGIGYIGYMTFVVAYLQSLGLGPTALQWFWGGLGICAALGGLVWAQIGNRIGSRASVALMMFLLAIASFLPVLLSGATSLALSAVLFGGSFLAIVAAISTEVQRQIPADRWAVMMGHAVSLFAFGQLLGPTLTGLVSDLPGGLALGMLLSGAVLGLAAVTVLLGKPRA
ncbi:MAG: YbfB/YjiJ family MFS transporter [Oscillochloris sp.]|nr:YbfB/YjiJ family MFS transporter [Oscillochloris sp.]